jgi:hypothetical protein
MSEAESKAALGRTIAAIDRELHRIDEGTITELRPTYSREEVQRYAERLLSGSVDHDAPILDFSMSAGPTRKSKTSATSYVYSWCDKNDNVFYVGKGFGDRAWSQDGHHHALRYATHFLGGQYAVHILCDKLTDSVATRIEEQLLNRFGNAFANWANACLVLHLPLAELEVGRKTPLQQERRAQLQGLLKQHPKGQDKIEALHRFIAELRAAEQADEDAARVDALKFEHISLLHRMRLRIAEPRQNAVLADAVSRLVTELERLQRYREVIAAVDEFRASHPAHFVDLSHAGGCRVCRRDEALLKKRDAAIRKVAAPNQ